MNDTFLRACRNEVTEYTPVWFMRQAGRSLPGYRALRKKYDVLTLTQTPELAAQVSLEPIERLGVDAAILFADIMLLPIAMGMDVKIVDSVGPVIDDPINVPTDIDALRPFEPQSVDFLQQTIRLLRQDLKVPLIGFSGAPFTLASYMIEGKPTRQWLKTKRFMYEQPEAWHRLMKLLAEASVLYLHQQVVAGAQALQLFDSWVGCLAASDYREFVLPHMTYIFDELRKENVPLIHFGTDTSGLLQEFASVNADVIGIDWRADMARARAIVPADKAVQGNLDPMLLLGNEALLYRRVDALLQSMPEKKGYIFNFGHGVQPETDDTRLKALVEYVHDN